jgi:hypothetical protein
MSGDESGALEAWNRVGEPRNDLTRIDGLRRTRYDIAATMIGIAPGTLITPGRLERARRRLAALPAASATRVDYVPLAGGAARIDAALAERPVAPSRPIDVAVIASRAVVDREARASLFSPTGNGEEWTARWRWESERPLVEVALSAPGAFGLPAVWRIGGIRDAETFAVAGGEAREEHEAVSVGVSGWMTGSLAASAGLSAERWRGRNGLAGARAAIEMRPRAFDALALRVAGSAHAGRGVHPFTTLAVQAALRTAFGGGFDATGRLALTYASATAPRMLWNGAGTGRAREALLRAHPLLDGGVVAGPVFGRTVAAGTFEVERSLVIRGPVRIGAAAFVDGARAAGRDPPGSAWKVDAGVGLRVGLFEDGNRIRLDFAHGLADGARALSIAWETPWPAR